ncbi:MAG: photosystem reaction center subunit [Rhodospirillales bacterium]|nr:photosystem reaction center subunit [Rhodospirillales bacterium]
MIRRPSHCSSALAFAVVLFLFVPPGTWAEEVGLVKLDVKDVAKGYRAEALKLRSVVNDKGETIGRIDDFIFDRDGSQVFAVLAVGDFIGLDGHLIAVPFRSLKLDDSSGSIVLPGASRSALLKLPVFLYNR